MRDGHAALHGARAGHRRGGRRRSDLFAAGAILFEMLAGRPAFERAHRSSRSCTPRCYEQPPALTGSPAVAARRPRDPPGAGQAAGATDRRRPMRWPRSCAAFAARTATTRRRWPTRSRASSCCRSASCAPIPETDFLAFSLPDAIATSLSGIGSLIVRSSAAAARFAGEAPDLKALAAEADVDRVVMGTLLRSGDQLRAAAQLVEAPGGTLLTSHTVQSSLGDLFRLQDDIARRVVGGAVAPAGGRGRRRRTPDAPHDARAYELYLRANELARTYDGLAAGARPVPALPRARSALRAGVGAPRPLPPRDRQVHRRPRPTARRAPRTRSAARSRSTRACPWRTSSTPTSRPTSARRSARWCGCWARPTVTATIPSCSRGSSTRAAIAGSYEQSIAAHAEARRLDPNVPTSLEQTLLMTGDIERLLAVEPPPLVAGARRRHPGHRPGAGRASRRGAPRLLDMRQAVAHSRLSDRGPTT